MKQEWGTMNTCSNRKARRYCRICGENSSRACAASLAVKDEDFSGYCQVSPPSKAEETVGERNTPYGARSSSTSGLSSRWAHPKARSLCKLSSFEFGTFPLIFLLPIETVPPYCSSALFGSPASSQEICKSTVISDSLHRLFFIASHRITAVAYSRYERTRP